MNSMLQHNTLYSARSMKFVKALLISIGARQVRKRSKTIHNTNRYDYLLTSTPSLLYNKNYSVTYISRPTESYNFRLLEKDSPN